MWILQGIDKSGSTPMFLRNLALWAFALFCVLLLIAVLLVRTVGETGGTNAYALVAESLLRGTPDVFTCFGADCGLRDGKTYIVFPPFPSLLALPLVWLNGIHTTGFMAISLILMAGSLAIWHRIFGFLGLAGASRAWLLLAIGFASPLYYVSLHGDGIWFFAQGTAFFLVTLAFHEAMQKRLVTAGLALAAAVLCRQMSIFYAPLLLLLWLDDDEPLFRIDGQRIRAALLLGLPIAAGLLVYFAYNMWRFGDPLETGYRFIQAGGLMKNRLEEYGLWNQAYVPFNFFYYFLQGFHVDFAPPQYIKLVRPDPLGTSVLAASPWLLLLFFAGNNRKTWAALALILGLTGVLLFYHSNGFSQHNTMRYALDWFPAALLILAPALTTARLEWVRLLIVWGLVLNVAAMAVIAVAKGG